ncbi:hypothetical protein AVEN_40876-1 [Araneus ventricosus]|uniref:Uncharacterized protein n=1 Tax=Araneus ventricosus TaxID=182803 RepID=A0A4Y2SPF7_ARAVE|nr:hypothetical protein AVEN_40876-1 [Araneus ventricosus]
MARWPLTPRCESIGKQIPCLDWDSAKRLGHVESRRGNPRVGEEESGWDNCPAVYNLMSTAVSRSLRYLSIISCYSHGKSLPSNASLMVGKRVLQGEAWSDLSDTYGTHDLGDHFGDKFGDLGDK